MNIEHWTCKYVRRTINNLRSYKAEYVILLSNKTAITLNSYVSNLKSRKIVKLVQFYQIDCCIPVSVLWKTSSNRRLRTNFTFGFWIIGSIWIQMEILIFFLCLLLCSAFGFDADTEWKHSRIFCRLIWPPIRETTLYSLYTIHIAQLYICVYVCVLYIVVWCSNEHAHTQYSCALFQKSIENLF